MLPVPQLSTVLPTLRLITEHGPWARAVALHYLQGPPPGAPAGSPPQPLWPGASALAGARFTPLGGPDSLYLGYDGATALAEVQAIYVAPASGGRAGSATTFGQVLHDPIGVFSVDGVVAGVLDLTDKAIQAVLNTSDTELGGPWLRAQARHQKGQGPLPPTQLLGQQASACGIVGLKYESARLMGGVNVTGVNLVVFTANLPTNAANYVQVHNTHGVLTQRLP